MPGTVRRWSSPRRTRGASKGSWDPTEPWYVDDFGHPYYEGAGRYLSELVGRRLGARVRYEKPGSIQRSLAETVSRTDALEAEMAGRAAVMYVEEAASRT